MSQITFEPASLATELSTDAGNDYTVWRWYMVPLVFAFAVDLLTPQLYGWGVIPRATLWLSDLAIGAMIFIALMRMLLDDNIPRPFLIIVAFTLFGVMLAMFEGQGLGITAFGVRRLFQYPLVGLYVYMMPQWPPKSATWLLRICLIILGLNVVFQIGQYVYGVDPGDLLAGTFGPFGVGPLSMFTFLVISFGLGKWLVSGDWLYLATALSLGVVASALGEIKLFPVAVLLLTVLAFIIQLVRGRHLSRLISVIVLTVAIVAAFSYVYNTLAPEIGVNARQVSDYLDVTVLDDYFGRTYNSIGGGYSLGRTSEAANVWSNNLRSPTSFLFGRGIGSRAQSATLGLSGSYYRTSFYNAGPGNSLSVLLQETGVLGILTFTAFCIATIIALYRRAVRNGITDLAALQYGLLLFTFLWPLWLWYLPVWLQAIPMLLYWSSVGYSMNSANNQAVQEDYEANLAPEA